jgi:hypothetical protein
MLCGWVPCLEVKRSSRHGTSVSLFCSPPHHRMCGFCVCRPSCMVLPLPQTVLPAPPLPQTKNETKKTDPNVCSRGVKIPSPPLTCSRRTPKDRHTDCGVATRRSKTFVPSLPPSGSKICELSRYLGPICFFVVTVVVHERHTIQYSTVPPKVEPTEYVGYDGL